MRKLGVAPGWVPANQSLAVLVVEAARLLAAVRRWVPWRQGRSIIIIIFATIFIRRRAAVVHGVVGKCRGLSVLPLCSTITRATERFGEKGERSSFCRAVALMSTTLHHLSLHTEVVTLLWDEVLAMTRSLCARKDSRS